MVFKKQNDLDFSIKNITFFGYIVIAQFVFILIDFFVKIYVDISLRKEYIESVYDTIFKVTSITNILWVMSIYLIFKEKLNIKFVLIASIIVFFTTQYDYFIFAEIVHNFFIKNNFYPSFLNGLFGEGYDYNFPKYFIMLLTIVVLAAVTIYFKFQKQRLYVLASISLILFSNIIFNYVNKMIIDDIKIQSRESSKETINLILKTNTNGFYKLCKELGFICVEDNIKNPTPKTENEIANTNIGFIVKNLNENKESKGGVISSNYINNSYYGIVQKNDLGDYRIIMKIDTLDKIVKKWDFWTYTLMFFYNLIVFSLVLFILSFDYKKSFKDSMKNS